MRKVDSIISYIDYGKIVYNIKPLVEKNKLTKSQIVKKNRTKSSNCSEIYEWKCRKI